MGSLPSPNIPTLDFSPYDNNSPAARISLARSLITAFRTTGFVTLTNHGVSPSLLSSAFTTSKQLFALPLDQKLLAPHPPGPEVHRGYSQPGLEKVSQYYGGDENVGKKLRQVVDCKESYEIGSEGNPEQPNVWLPEHVLPGFKDFTTEFYWHCHSLSQKILHLIALGLELPDPEYFLNFHSGQNNQLRLLHYPPIPAREIEEDRAARISAHTDWGTITLLFQDDCGGLEIEDPNSEGKFVPVVPVEGACVVNVGDLLMRWTNDRLKSTLHRVTLPPLADRFEGKERMTRARYSIPYFVSADSDALVESLSACVDQSNPAKYEPVTQEAYRRMRGKLQYRKEDSAQVAATAT